MRALVLDASAVAAWVMPSQATASSDCLLMQIEEFDLAVPYIFAWEIGNLFVRQSKRGLLLANALEFLGELGIGYAEAHPPKAVLNLTNNAVGLRLSLFDTAYLALAADLDAPLASRDAGLITAAAGLGLECLDLRDTQTK